VPDYDWKEHADDPAWRRFPDWAVGAGLWREYGRGVPETLPRLLAELIYMRGDQPAGLSGLVCPRVFISHKQQDDARAKEIAALATTAGFEYWLDVFDPTLLLAAGRAGSADDAALEIATIVEMALLNCSHVIAVLTKRAETSRWVPYEYGRVKDSSLFSSKAACWIDTDVKTADLAEYMRLGTQTRSDLEISQWLQSELTRWQAHNPRCTSGGGDTGAANGAAPAVPTETNPPDVLAALVREYNDGLQKPITVRRPLVLKKAP